MKKLIFCLFVAVCATIFTPFTAHAEDITVASVEVKGWAYTTSGTVQVKFELDQDGVDSDGVLRLRGTGPIVTATVSADAGFGYKLTIPMFHIESTTDWVRPKNARYNVFFVLPNGKRIAYTDFTGMKVDSAPTSTTMAAISLYNKSAGDRPMTVTSYTRDEIDYLLGTVAGGGITSINGLTGTTQTLADGTNIDVVSSGSTHTFNITGQVAVANGGTGGANAAAARTNLGVAALGANSDITSLSALSTPLSAIQGGSGFASFTVGDILYADTTTSLARRNAVATGSIFASAGVSTAPVWTATPSITSITLATPLAATSGGSGFASYAVGDLLYANTTTSLAKLADVATGRVLVSGGIGVAPAYSATPSLTSLTLSSPLLGTSGGTGFASYTVGDVLYADTTTTLAKLGAGTAGYVLSTQGAGLPPQWVAATGGTVGGTGANGRVTYWTGAAALGSSSTYLFDSATGRLSVGTTASDQRINLPNASIIGIRNAADSLTKQVIGLDGSDIINIAGSANRVNIGGQVVNNISASSDFSAGDVTTYSGDYQITPIASWFATKGAYSTNSPGNNFHVSSYATSAGTRATVALFGQAVGTVAGAQVWGINPVAYVDTAGANPVAHAIEADFGSLGTSATASAYGIVIGAVGDADTVAGTNKNYIQMQVSSTGIANAKPANGIVFEGTTVSPVVSTGSLITISGASLSVGSGVDFAGGAFTAGAFKAPSGTTNGYNVNNVANSLAINLARNVGDVLQFGDSVSAVLGVGLYSASTQPSIYLSPGNASTLPGNVGFNQTTTSAQIHETAILKRALTGTNYTLNSGSPNVVATGSAFLSEVAPGSSMVFSSEPTKAYTVLSVTSDTALVLTGNAVTNTTTATALGDYASLLIEAGKGSSSGGGDDWLTLDNQHTLKLYGDSSYSDLRGMLSLTSRSTTSKRMTMGVNDTSSYSYISSFQEGVGWKPLIIQGGASQSAAGGMVIGVSSISSVGAMLKVESGQIDPGANNVGSEFNNLSTNSAGTEYEKIAAQYLSQGAWNGRSIGLYARPIEATRTSTGDRTNYPIFAVGGKSYFWPGQSLITTPTVPTEPDATVDIYGYPEDSISIGSDTLQTTAGTTVNGTGTTWDTVAATDRLRSGDAVMFNADTRVYQIDSVTNDTSFKLTGAYAGTPASGIEGWRDKNLLKLSNAFGTERLKLEGNGFMKLTGTFVQNGASIASAAALPAYPGNLFLVSGATTVTSILLDNGTLAADASQSWKIITIIWDTGATFDMTDSAALNLAGGNITTFTAGDSVTLATTDGTNFLEISRADN